MDSIDINDSIPMVQLKKYMLKYPSFFRWIDKAYNDPSAPWDKTFCYCPIGIAIGYLLDGDFPEYAPDYKVRAARADSGRIAVLSSWRKAKSIYRLDRDLAASLYDTSDKDIAITRDMIFLPEWCIYIDTDLFSDVKGFFVMIDDDDARKNKELYIIPVNNDGELATQLYLPLPREGEKRLLSEILKDEIEESYVIDYLKEHPSDTERYFQMASRAMKFIVNFILYLSAINSEVRPVRRRRSLPSGKIKDTARDVSVYSVGEKAGYRIRELRRYESEHTVSAGHHRPHAVHIRRAHWHTFLYGKGRKQRRVKWMPPMVIGANGEEIDIPTVTVLKKEQ